MIVYNERCIRQCYCKTSAREPRGLIIILSDVRITITTPSCIAPYHTISLKGKGHSPLTSVVLCVVVPLVCMGLCSFLNRLRLALHGLEKTITGLFARASCLCEFTEPMTMTMIMTTAMTMTKTYGVVFLDRIIGTPSVSSATERPTSRRCSACTTWPT